MSAAGDLVHLLREKGFRDLFAVRFASQFTDGVFQVALASYVIFSPERQPSPGAIAAALAVVLLPFSVLGPFAGVLLDRWSRRQVLVWSNLVRVPMLLLLAVGFGYSLGGPALFGLVLVCLSVNRFLLAGLSAALPHVVRRDELIMANAVTPTGGTFAFLLGLGAGGGARAVWQAVGVDGNVGALLTASVLYAGAGLLARRIPRALLGPDFDPARPAAREAVRHVLRGMVAGLGHLRERREAAYGLTAIGAHRFFFGISSVALILLYRNYFHDPGDADAAFNDLSVAVLVTGAGFVVAAVVTPVAVRHIAARTWMLSLLVAAALTQVVPGALYTRPAMLVSAFALGLASQGIKICVDTLVQVRVDDAFRGRVFSLYDVIFNVAFVAAAAVGAAVLPADGKSYPVLGAVAVGYLVTAVFYAHVTRQPSPAPGPVPSR